MIGQSPGYLPDDQTNARLEGSESANQQTRDGTNSYRVSNRVADAGRRVGSCPKGSRVYLAKTESSAGGQPVAKNNFRLGHPAIAHHGEHRGGTRPT